MNKIYPILTAMFLGGCAPVNTQVVPEPKPLEEVVDTPAEQAEYVTYSILEGIDYSDMKEKRLDLVLNGSAPDCGVAEGKDKISTNYHVREFQRMLTDLSKGKPGELDFPNSKTVLVREDGVMYIAVGDKNWKLKDLYFFGPESGCDGVVFRDVFTKPENRHIPKVAENTYNNLGE